MSLIRDAWCVILRQCRPFDWYVLRCVCRVLYQLVPALLFRRCVTMRWLLKHAVRRDSVSLLEWLHARPQVAVWRETLVNHAARHDARAALHWLLESVEIRMETAQLALHKAARRGHLEMLKELDSRLAQSAIERLHPAAVRGGHLHVLKWLHARYPIVNVSSEMYTTAVEQRRHAVLHWLRSVDQSRACETSDACMMAARAGDIRALALLLEPDADARATLLTQRCSDAALFAYVRTRLYSAHTLPKIYLMRCAAAHDNLEMMMRAQPWLPIRTVCKWAHICCKSNAVRVLRWLVTVQPVREWHADRHWMLLCDTAARRGHVGVLRVLREACTPAPWLTDTMQHVAMHAPAQSMVETLEYGAANGAPQWWDARALVQHGRVEALRWLLARGDICLPSELCNVAAINNQYAALRLLHDGGVCPWPLAYCAPTTLHARDAARLLAPHLC